MRPTRRAGLKLLYNSADISADVTGFLLNFAYGDKANSRETDDLSLTFEDKDGLWRSGWFPERGAKVEATLTCENWPGGKVLDCGAFEIDDCESSGGAGSTFAVRAVAIGITNSIRRERKTKGWEQTTFKTIAEEVASMHGFELFYDTTIDPDIDRYDQRQQTDIEMLAEICSNNGLGLKATDGKIVIFEERFYEARDPQITLTRNPDGYISHSLRASASDIYGACEVKYLDPQTRLVIAHKFEPPASSWSGTPPPSGHVLKVSQLCKCEDEAIRLARAKLREQNKQEVGGTVTVLGDPDIRSGLVAALSGFGKFDTGKYLVERAEHSYSKDGGYETRAVIRGVLDY